MCLAFTLSWFGKIGMWLALVGGSIFILSRVMRVRRALKPEVLADESGRASIAQPNEHENS